MKAYRIDKVGIDLEGQLVVHMTGGKTPLPVGASQSCMVFASKQAAFDWATEQFDRVSDEYCRAAALFVWLGDDPTPAKDADAAGKVANLDKADYTAKAVKK